MGFYYLFAALLLLQALISLRGGARYLRYFRRELSAPRSVYTPYASVIVPCRGLDQDLHKNLDALYQQHYPSFEIIFVVDSLEDPALEIIERVRAERGSSASVPARVVVAGRANGCGQKVHNLIAAVRAVDERSEVLVFVDTDARPRRDWLRSLVAPLTDEKTGAATGYRWFIPSNDLASRHKLASHLRAVWNASIASALGENRRANFCWGGSTAIRRTTFAALDMPERWRGTLSDDFALTRALQDARLHIRFVPHCLTPSYEDCSGRELFEFTTRQLKITRVYAPRLWQVVLVSNLLFVAVFYGGLALSLARFWRGLPTALPLAFVAAIYVLGSCKALLRLRAVALAFGGEHKIWRAVTICAHLSLWPLASALFLYNALAAARSRRIRWRGIVYELKSPTETGIIDAARFEDTTADKKRVRRA
ncbi:MAG TPA: glycosyltransferase family 2 protein [Pyrinomonadaceae bacterium]|jgi:cellulose synthase/poly-beta-1,6-N-acetylglucosamine synthase-like glycosyltransferase